MSQSNTAETEKADKRAAYFVLPEQRKTIMQKVKEKKKRKVKRQIRDRFFRFLFEKDKEALLELYNALNGTSYQDASQLEVVTHARRAGRMWN